MLNRSFRAVPSLLMADLLHWDPLANPSLKDKVPREGHPFSARRADAPAERAA